jgi:hypothetical protein
MSAAPAVADRLTVRAEVSAASVRIVYVVDARPAADLVIHQPDGGSEAANDLLVACAALYLAALCLAREVRIERPLSRGLLDELRPIAGMLDDIRRWKDELPLAPEPPRLRAPVRERAPSDQPIGPRRATLTWSGGKDSTLALLTLRANGYVANPLHLTLNSGAVDAERAAVRRLGVTLGAATVELAVEHEDFLSLSNAYAREWDDFPLCNRVPFGRDLLVSAVAVRQALAVGAGCVSLGHDNECRTASVVHQGKTIPRNDLESAEAALILEQAVRRHVHPGLRLLPPVANLSEYRILHDMFTTQPELMALTSFCFWGRACGRCAKCLRYFLADRLFGAEVLRFEVNPMATGACPELVDVLDPAPRSTLFQDEIQLMMGRLAQRGQIRAGEDELDRFRTERLATVAPLLDGWERDLMAVRDDPQIPPGFRPITG